MQLVNLTTCSWRLKGYWPWVPLLGNSVEAGNELMGVTEWMPATVPGGVHYDLYRAGLIRHPWFETNSVDCEWVEHRWWVYQTTIDRMSLPECAGKAELVFQGLDYEALVYLNSELLGEHQGMFHPAVFDITSMYREGVPLTLTVIFKHAPDEMGQIGRTSLTSTQKSRFNYKWDFSTRLVNIGIWDGVYLHLHDIASLKDVAVTAEPSPEGEFGKVTVSAEIEITADTAVPSSIEGSLQLHLSLVDLADGNVCAESNCSINVRTGAVEAALHVPNPRVWYPNGYGEQPLYELRLQLTGDGSLLDERKIRTGFRTIRYKRNDGSPPDSLPYTFVINGTKTYIQGVNITPIDHLYGNVLPEQYAYLVEMMKRAGVNMVRVWGGGLIEKELFYDLCDRNGILIWQEFIQSSSGLDNVPSKLPQFLGLLRKTAVASLKQKRNHPSLAVWSGGNELRDHSERPSTYEDDNIAMLKQLVETYDPNRLFLPTSASGPVEFVTKEQGVGHDVHGFWKYMGDPEHYELYGNADHLFHSEFGVDGMSCPKSIRKFMGEANQTPSTMKENLVWRHHGEWWDTLERDRAIFGPLDTLELSSDASQWVQAEGLRFILQANRRRQFRSSGSLIWQLNEPYPNVSNTCLIDYYGEAKMAYYWTRQSFRTVDVSLDYRKLSYRIGEKMAVPVFVSGPIKTTATVTVQVYDMYGNLRHEQRFEEGPGEGARHIGVLSLTVTEALKGLFMIRLAIQTQGDIGPEQQLPDYYFSAGEEAIYTSAVHLNGAELECVAEGDWEVAGQSAGGLSDRLSSMRRKFAIRNTGRALALHVRCEETTNAYWTAADDLYFTLLPGERRVVEITCFRKRAGGFLAEDGSDGEGKPDLEFRSFGSDSRYEVKGGELIAEKTAEVYG